MALWRIGGKVKEEKRVRRIDAEAVAMEMMEEMADQYRETFQKEAVIVTSYAPGILSREDLADMVLQLFKRDLETYRRKDLIALGCLDSEILG